MAKTLIPDEFRDFLSIISFLGLFGTFLLFVFGNPLLSENMDAVFLIVSGGGLMVAGKVFSINKWLKDGLQRNEVTMILSVVIGISATIVGVLLLTKIALPETITGLGGWVALFAAIFIAADYYVKNKRR